VAHFVDCILTMKKTIVDLDDAIKTFAIIESANRSASAGGTAVKRRRVPASASPSRLSPRNPRLGRLATARSGNEQPGVSPSSAPRASWCVYGSSSRSAKSFARPAAFLFRFRSARLRMLTRTPSITLSTRSA
jgi:hypothetical protein